MKAFREDHIEREASVWVWDGSWLPAVPADVVLEPGHKVLIVQFENDCSAPTSWADVEPRGNRRGRRLRRAAASSASALRALKRGAELTAPLTR